MNKKEFDIKQFIKQANKTPLLKNYRQSWGEVTYSTLLEAEFIKKDYSVQDLSKLEKLLTEFNVPQTPKRLHNKGRDLRHMELIKLYDNQKLISDWRMTLKIPPVGIKTESQFKKWSKEYVGDTTYLKNFKNVTRRFLHVRYTGNINDTKSLKGVEILPKKVSRAEVLEIAINEILEKWKLPERYRVAVHELIIFNRVIAAPSGVSIISFEQEWGNKKILGITFDRDTTKEKIVEFLKHPGTRFSEMKKDLKGRVYRKHRKAKKTEKIIEFYNEQKKEGEKEQKIFQEIAKKYGLKPSAIRKRIKGK